MTKVVIEMLPDELPKAGKNKSLEKLPGLHQYILVKNQVTN